MIWVYILQHPLQKCIDDLHEVLNYLPCDPSKAVDKRKENKYGAEPLRHRTIRGIKKCRSDHYKIQENSSLDNIDE